MSSSWSKFIQIYRVGLLILGEKEQDSSNAVAWLLPAEKAELYQTLF